MRHNPTGGIAPAPQVPEAHITTNKNRLAVSRPANSVYLDDGEAFEIELFNPTRKKVLAKIKLNGEYISQAGLVLNPGQRVYLERYLDTNNRFRFGTYEVDGSPEAMAAIASNGAVRVEFHDEWLPAIRVRNPWYPDTADWTYRPGQVVYGDPLGQMPDYQVHYTTDKTDNSGRQPAANTTCQCSAGTATAQNAGAFVSPEVSDFSAAACYAAVETGRVEKGEETAQAFVDSNDEFNPFATWSSEYRILPKSARPATASDLRTYCTGCGRKMKPAWKFCPTCGEGIS